MGQENRSREDPEAGKGCDGIDRSSDHRVCQRAGSRQAGSDPGHGASCSLAPPVWRKTYEFRSA